MQPSIVAEVQTMKLLKHPNILPLYAAFLDDDQLWMVMPYVSGGSASDIMRRTSPNVSPGRACCRPCVRSFDCYHTPDKYAMRLHSLVFMQGLNEHCIATIMKPVCSALAYLHKDGYIHRDLKVLMRILKSQ
jgi:serine/threonine-protein kinase OSR1/STK39